MIKYNVDSQGNVIVIFEGEIDYRAIALWLRDFSKIENLPLNLFLLYDLQKAFLNIDAATLIRIIEKVDDATTNFNQIHTAFVLNKTHISNYAGLFSFLKPNIRSIRKAFSTYEDAHAWLNNEKRKSGNSDADVF